jgi:hypothetical protein
MSHRIVIRIITGPRPFRPSGFVVRTEKIGGKVVIHNYHAFTRILRTAGAGEYQPSTASQ